MKLDSLHNTPISEKAEQPAPQGDPLDALRLDAPEGGAPAPEGQEEAPEAQDEASEQPEPGHPEHKVSEIIDAVEKLQHAAANLEAAKFVVQTEYSDFTLARALDQLKQQLIPLINKAKEHMMKSGSQDPQSEKKVATWLDM